MKKRGLAVVLSTTILVTALLPFSICAFSSNKLVTPNMSVLNSMLYGDRHWVIETLVNDSRANNPIIILEGQPLAKSMARESIDKYKGIDVNGETHYSAYRLLVQTMEKVYSADEYVDGLVNEVGELLPWVVGLFPGSDEAKKTANNLVSSTDEMRYDRLLKSVFTASYAGSNGETIGEVENNLILMRKTKDALEYFKNFMAFVNSDIDSIIGGEHLLDFNVEYIDNYAIPYADAAETYLSGIAELSHSDTKKSSEALVNLASCLAVIEKYEVMKPLPSYDGFSYHDYLGDYLVDSVIKSVLSGAGKTLNIADDALDSYLYINAIQQQRESIIGPIERMTASTDNQDMKDALLHFSDLMSDEYDKQILSTDSLVEYLRQNRSVNKLICSGSKALAKKLFHVSEESLAGAAMAKGTSIVSTSAWVADKAIGLEDTCKKTYELLYWEELMNLCLSQYRADVKAYEQSPDDDTAARVLDDLLLLQRLRLYGEKIAYGLAAGQMNSIFGQLYGGGMLLEEWENTYQRSVDAILAAAVIPSYTGLAVEANETMVVHYRDDIGFYGSVRNNRTGGSYYIVDLASKLAGGITVSGILAIDNSSGVPLAIGYIDANPNANVGVTSGDVLIGEVFQHASSKLQAKNAAEIVVNERLVLDHCSYTADQNQSIRTKDLDVLGAISNGLVEATGNVSGQKGSLTSLVLLGENQTVSGTLSAAQLDMDGTVVTLDGAVTVTETLYQPKGNLINSENLVFSGHTIENNVWAYPITLKNATVSGVTFEKDVTDQGGTTYLGNCLMKGMFSMKGDSCVAEDAGLTIRQSMSMYGRTLSGTGNVSAYSDISSGGGIIHPTLILCGRTPQTISGTMTVDHAVFSRAKAVTLDGAVTVVKSLENTSCETLGQEPILLGESACLVGDVFYGNLKVSTWNIPVATKITGTLTARSGSEITCPSLNIDGDLIAEGTLALSCGEVRVGGTLSAVDQLTVTTGKLSVQELISKGITMENGAAMTVWGSAACSGTLHGSDEPMIFGDLTANGLTVSGEAQIAGDLSVSGGTSFEHLTLNGQLPQCITGSDFNVVDLHLFNTTKKGISVEQTIFVSGEYKNTGNPVNGISISKNASFTTDQHFQRGLKLSGDLTLDGCTMQVEGDLSMADGVIALKDAHLIVQGSLEIPKGITVDETSTVTVKNWTRAGGSCQINGAFTARSDLYLSGTLSGSGQLTVFGDLDSSGEIRIGTLTFPGLLPQRVKGTTLQAGDLQFSNSSRKGLVLMSAIQYTGEVTGLDCIQSGVEYVKKQEG